MEKKTFYGVEVVYDEKNVNYEHLKVIENNHRRFLEAYEDKYYLSFVPTSDPRAVYCGDFDNFFRDFIRSRFNEEVLNSKYDISLSALFYEYEKSIHEFVPVPYGKSQEMEYDTIKDLIAYKYYQENGTYEDFIDHLKYHKDFVRPILWIQHKEMYGMLDTILGLVSKRFTEMGFGEPIEIMDEDFLKEILKQYNVCNSKKIDDLPEVEEEDIYKLFDEFLDYIDAPDEWKQMYSNLKESGNLSPYSYSCLVNRAGCYREDEDSPLKIALGYDETINTFFTLVHEFAHYVSLSRGEENKVLGEFPSILAERLAIDFVKSKGFSDEAANSVIYKRLFDNINIVEDLYPILLDIYHHNIDGVVTRESKYSYFKPEFIKLHLLQEDMIDECVREGLPARKKKPFPTEKELNRMIDDNGLETIRQFFQFNYKMTDGMKYIVASILVNQAVAKNDSSFNLKRLFEVVDHLSEYDVDRIKREFNLVEKPMELKKTS